MKMRRFWGVTLPVLVIWAIGTFGALDPFWILHARQWRTDDRVMLAVAVACLEIIGWLFSGVDWP